MHKRLRHQVKMDEISEKLNKRKNNFFTYVERDLAFNTNKPVLVQRFDTTRKATV
jgi:hypothetical protein